MKSKPLSIVVVLLVALTLRVGLAGPSAVTVTLEHRSVKQAHYVLNATFPRISGLRKATLQVHINALLRKALPVQPPSAEDVARMGPTEVYKEEVKYTVTLNQHHLLSLLYSGLGFQTKDGHFNAAHPSKLIRALTLDLDSGRLYHYKDLFKPGADGDTIVRKHFSAELAPMADSDQTQRSFYLTPGKLVIVFPDAPYAVQGAEVTVPLADLAVVANPKGPLARLIHR